MSLHDFHRSPDDEVTRDLPDRKSLVRTILRMRRYAMSTRRVAFVALAVALAAVAIAVLLGAP